MIMREECTHFLWQRKRKRNHWILKYEIADEIGLGDKILKGGWKSLTSKESGRIGGLMTKRKRELKREALENDVAVQKIPIREQ